MVGLAGLALVMTAAPGRSQPPATGQAWLHVRVDEPSKQGKVTVNLPLSVVSVALEAAPEHLISEGHFKMGQHLGDRDLKVADLRRAWAELKKSGDTEFATVEEDDEKVRIARAGDLVLVHVDKAGGGGESVRVEVPVSVVDALFSAPGDELNIRAALGELQKRRGDIVRVKDEGSTVRIWIDEAN
jgi:hypothetical protein